MILRVLAGTVLALAGLAIIGLLFLAWITFALWAGNRLDGCLGLTDCGAAWLAGLSPLILAAALLCGREVAAMLDWI
jgi:hypothetical protein